MSVRVQSHKPDFFPSTFTPTSTSCVPFPTSLPVSSSSPARSPVLRKRALTPPSTPVSSITITHRSTGSSSPSTTPDINTRPTKTQRLTRNTMGHPTALRRSESVIFELASLSESDSLNSPISYPSIGSALAGRSKNANDNLPSHHPLQAIKDQQQQQLRRKEREREQKERERGRARNRLWALDEARGEMPPVPPLPSGLISTSKSKVWMPSASGSCGSISNFSTASGGVRSLKRQSAVANFASSSMGTTVTSRQLNTSQLRPACITPSPSSDSLASFFSASPSTTHTSTITTPNLLTSLPVRATRAARTRTGTAPLKVILPSVANPYTTVISSRPRSPLVPEEHRTKPQANLSSTCPAMNPNSKLSRPPQSGKRSKPDVDYYRTAIRARLNATSEGQRLLRMGPRLAMAIMNATQELEKMVGEGGWDLGEADADGEDCFDMDIDAEGEEDPDAEGEDDVDMLDTIEIGKSLKSVRNTITATTTTTMAATSKTVVSKTTTWTPTPIQTSIAMAMSMSLAASPLSKSPPKTSLARPVMTTSWVVVKGEDWEMVECAA